MQYLIIVLDRNQPFQTESIVFHVHCAYQLLFVRLSMHFTIRTTLLILSLSF